ncbi:cupin domain-containing protein [Corallococcus praedator]|uniref:Cupin domain-containing protein n=1 Tax=Corallococcus praedator TaxID=2316724 RepID=A0ABX9QB53_9BACT|nr:MULTISPECIES: cupin domain-containing protein [Corallococcus]RKH07760.1 cupin domain-containing protein [Corallococcus sp. CA047B]RKH32188.1 cupin domain-containing protein [Corallococcus sp. CA031C]RKH97876.1 cupin domain-containing protein [Corallococcus praedator]
MVEELVRRLDLKPHPEGGYYRETYRAAFQVQTLRGRRSAGTAIYYLLTRGIFSAWHRVVGADELWLFHDGDPLSLHLMHEDGRLETAVLGRDVLKGEQPQVLVPAGVLQAAETLGDYTLVGCTVSPGFEFADFELPDGEAIVARHPAHEVMIRRLSKR